MGNEYQLNPITIPVVENWLNDETTPLKHQAWLLICDLRRQLAAMKRRDKAAGIDLRRVACWREGAIRERDEAHRQLAAAQEIIDKLRLDATRSAFRLLNYGDHSADCDAVTTPSFDGERKEVCSCGWQAAREAAEAAKEPTL